MTTGEFKIFFSVVNYSLQEGYQTFSYFISLNGMDSVLPHQGKPVYALRETAYNMLQTKVAKATRTKYSGKLNLM